MVALLGSLLLILVVLGLFMARQGLSLRPLAWFGCVFVLILGPQVAVHLATALTSHAEKGSDATEATVRPATTVQHSEQWWTAPTTAPTTPQALQRMLGGSATNAMVSDLAPLFAAFGAPARWAQFIVTPDGRTAIVASFADDSAAMRGAAAWLTSIGLPGQAVRKAQQGLSGTRPAGDQYFLRTFGRHVIIWTAPDATTLRAFISASHVPAPAIDPMRPDRAAAVLEPPPFGLSWAAALALLGAYTLFVSAVFIKGAAWASALPAYAAARSSAKLSENALRARLLAINDSGVPFAVRPGRNADEVVVEWRYADARWVDHACAHVDRRTHRLVLRLDAVANAVFVSEFHAVFDASAGADGARLNWNFASGIVFFQYATERVVGV